MAKASKKKRGKTKKTAKTKKVKKRKKRTIRKKAGSTKIRYESVKEIKLDRALTDNFVALQRVLVNISKKFDNLSNEISKLLNLFEISAQTLAKKDVESGGDKGDTKKILEKLDNISQHAGLIGRGLALIHEQGKEREEELPKMQRSSPAPVPRPMMTPPQRQMRPLNPMNNPSQQEGSMHMEAGEGNINKKKNSF